MKLLKSRFEKKVSEGIFENVNVFALGRTIYLSPTVDSNIKPSVL
jgi:hypothetical protein